MSKPNPALVNSKPMRELLRDHLSNGRSISNVEAQALWRCRALPKRISELEASGMKMERERCKDSTGQSYVRYRWADYDSESRVL